MNKHDRAEVFSRQMTNTYSDFNSDLKKEQDTTARDNLTRFYQAKLPEFEIQMIDYNSDYGKFLQTAGVDIILTKYNSYGGIKKQHWIQEKVTFKKYDSLLFEYEKKSGAKGWAVSPDEKADFLLYYLAGDIVFVSFPSVRKYIQDNLDRLKAQSYIKTDNHNIFISIEELQKNVKLLQFKADSY